MFRDLLVVYIALTTKVVIMHKLYIADGGLNRKFLLKLFERTLKTVIQILLFLCH